MLKRLCIYCFLAWSVVFSAAAYTPASVPNPRLTGQALYVANPDNILAIDDVAFLENCAAKLDAATHVEMVVVALRSIYNGDAFQFGYELFQRWGIGRREQNTGVLILFVLDSHDIRIVTGTGIEGVLTDAQCAAIIRDEMTPYFRAGDYGGGLCRGALHIYQTCTNGDAPEELLNMKSVTNRGGFGEAQRRSGVEIALAAVLLLLVLAFVIWLIWKPKKEKDPDDRYDNDGYGGGYWGGYYGGGYSSGYGGGFSGGFGGFGGGSTMGGGAGGKW